jgi:hypothetical protein
VDHHHHLRLSVAGRHPHTPNISITTALTTVSSNQPDRATTSHANPQFPARHLYPWQRSSSQPHAQSTNEANSCEREDIYLPRGIRLTFQRHKRVRSVPAVGLGHTAFSVASALQPLVYSVPTGASSTRHMEPSAHSFRPPDRYMPPTVG